LFEGKDSICAADHCGCVAFAAVAVLRDPRGRLYEVTPSVAEFIRKYQVLFLPDDIDPRLCPEHLNGRRNGEHWTRADRGLTDVVSCDVNSWKGWTLAIAAQ
jgi:hypothetical protein